MPSTAKFIQFNVFLDNKKRTKERKKINCMKWQKIASYQKKITNKKILTDDQHCDASESRANFGIYIGSLKHPKLSA